MPGRLGDVMLLSALIDSGVSVCVISEAMAISAGLTIVPMSNEEFGFSVLTANGTPLGLLGRVPGQVSFSMVSTLGSPMAFTFDDRIQDVTLFVCRNLPMPLILSFPFLEHYDLTIKSRDRGGTHVERLHLSEQK